MLYLLPNGNPTGAAQVLRALTYPQRAALLDQIQQVLQARRDHYLDIALQNSGTVARDSAIDVDGALYTLSYYAKLGHKLPDARHLADGGQVSLSRDGTFSSQHILVPSHGVALPSTAAPASPHPARRCAFRCQDRQHQQRPPRPRRQRGRGRIAGTRSGTRTDQQIGQKCTAIRRILVPAGRYDAIAQALEARFAKVTVGDPRNPDVRMGSLVSRDQRRAVEAGIATLASSCETLFDGRRITIQAPEDSACVAPVLFGTRDPDAHPEVHHTEVFGPVATLMPYRDLSQAMALARLGMGSLVASVYGEDFSVLAQAAETLAKATGACTWSAPKPPRPRPATATSCRDPTMAARPGGRRPGARWRPRPQFLSPPGRPPGVSGHSRPHRPFLTLARSPTTRIRPHSHSY
ncbi:NAD/NADP-dependent betaine aldehyde dehydrogenase [Castellaniella defragrans]